MYVCMYVLMKAADVCIYICVCVYMNLSQGKESKSEGRRGETRGDEGRRRGCEGCARLE